MDGSAGAGADPPTGGQPAGPLAPGVTGATGARHRVVYAQVARALRDQGGHPVTRIAEWLDVTRATVYNYLAADAH